MSKRSLLPTSNEVAQLQKVHYDIPPLSLDKALLKSNTSSLSTYSPIKRFSLSSFKQCDDVCRKHATNAFQPAQRYSVNGNEDDSNTNTLCGMSVGKNQNWNDPSTSSTHSRFAFYKMQAKSSTTEPVVTVPLGSLQTRTLHDDGSYRLKNRLSLGSVASSTTATSSRRSSCNTGQLFLYPFHLVPGHQPEDHAESKTMSVNCNVNNNFNFAQQTCSRSSPNSSIVEGAKSGIDDDIRALQPVLTTSRSKGSGSVQLFPTRHQFRCTKLCPFQLSGGCVHRNTCTYAHSETELRPLPDLRQTKLCEATKRGVPCLKPQCSYAHSFQELKPSSDLATYKTSLCFFWKKGRCLNGMKCRFAHGVGDLRQPVEESSRQPDLVKDSKMLLNSTSAYPSTSRAEQAVCTDPSKKCHTSAAARLSVSEFSTCSSRVSILNEDAHPKNEITMPFHTSTTRELYICSASATNPKLKRKNAGPVSCVSSMHTSCWESKAQEEHEYFKNSCFRSQPSSETQHISIDNTCLTHLQTAADNVKQPGASPESMLKCGLNTENVLPCSTQKLTKTLAPPAMATSLSGEHIDLAPRSAVGMEQPHHFVSEPGHIQRKTPELSPSLTFSCIPTHRLLPSQHTDSSINLSVSDSAQTLHTAPRFCAQKDVAAFNEDDKLTMKQGIKLSSPSHCISSSLAQDVIPTTSPPVDHILRAVAQWTAPDNLYSPKKSFFPNKTYFKTIEPTETAGHCSQSFTKPWTYTEPPPSYDKSVYQSKPNSLAAPSFPECQRKTFHERPCSLSTISSDFSDLDRWLRHLYNP